MLGIINLLVEYLEEKEGVGQDEIVSGWQAIKRNSEYRMDKHCAVLFEDIIEVAVKPGYTLEFRVLDVVVQIGQLIQQRSLISDEWWFKLTGLKVSRKSDGMNDLIDRLLDYGTTRENVHNWKAIMLLLEIVYQSQEGRRYTVQQLREVYNCRVGDLLDSINSFQLANYIIELVVNCFPRKYAGKSTLGTAPQFWEDNKKVRKFFNHDLYPDRCKHGEEELIQFVLNRFGNFFTNFGQVSRALCVIGKSSKGKMISRKVSYLQVIHQSIYFWDGEGMFMEMNPKCLEIVRDLRDVVKMTIVDQFTSVISSPHTDWIASLKKASCFQFTMMDYKVAEAVWNATKLPKISEVQTYISLRIPSSFDDGIIESSIQGNFENTEKNQEVQVNDETRDKEEEEIFLMGQQENTIMTPLNSNASLRNEKLVEIIPSSSQQLITPKRQKFGDFDHSIEEDDQSPLVIAQKRKIIRATSKTLEVLREEFGKGKKSLSDEAPKINNKQQTDNNPPIDDSTEFNLLQPMTPKNMRNSEPKKRTEVTINPTTDNYNKNNNKNSVLDDIFALPLPKKIGKKTDKQIQGKLNNFKPIVYVPSQDVPTSSKHASNPTHRVAVKRKIANSSYARKKKRKHFEDAFELSKGVEENAIQNPKPGRQTRSAKKAEQQKEPATVNTISNSEKVHNKNTSSNLCAQPPNNKNYNLTANTSENNINLELKSTDSTSPPPHKSAIMDSSHTEMSMLVPPHDKSNNPLFNSSFTNQLQEQIYHSVLNFSNELTRKISIINTEMNMKIITQLSEKYKTMFKDLQSNFQNDVDQIAGFVGEIKDMLHLPEHELVKVIRDKKFRQ